MIDLSKIAEVLGINIEMLALGAGGVIAWTAFMKKELKVKGRWCYASNVIPAAVLALFFSDTVQQGAVLVLIWTVGSAMIWQLAKDLLKKKGA